VDEQAVPPIDGYQVLLRELKARIRTAAPPSGIGRERGADFSLLDYRSRHSRTTGARGVGGSRVIDRISADLRHDFRTWKGCQPGTPSIYAP